MLGRKEKNTTDDANNPRRRRRGVNQKTRHRFRRRGVDSGDATTIQETQRRFGRRNDDSEDAMTIRKTRRQIGRRNDSEVATMTQKTRRQFGKRLLPHHSGPIHPLPQHSDRLENETIRRTRRLQLEGRNQSKCLGKSQNVKTSITNRGPN